MTTSVLAGIGRAEEVADVFHTPVVQACRGECKASTRIVARFQLDDIIQAITIKWQVGDLDRDWWPPIWKDSRNVKSYYATCTFNGKAHKAICEIDIGKLTQDNLIVYLAEALEKAGNRAIEPVAFAVQNQDKPYVATPIWWHCTDDPADEYRADLAFLPEAEYLSLGYGRFAEAANRLLENTFLSPGSKPFQYSRVFRRDREKFNLWLAGRMGSPNAGSGNLCDFSKDVSFDWIAAWMAASVLAHERAGLADCAAIEYEGLEHSASVQMDPPSARQPGGPWRLAHEAGHFLFGQSDEYCCNGGYRPRCDQGYKVGNVFLDPKFCEWLKCASEQVLRLCDKITGDSRTREFWRAGVPRGFSETLALREPPAISADSVFDEAEIKEARGVALPQKAPAGLIENLGETIKADTKWAKATQQTCLHLCSNLEVNRRAIPSQVLSVAYRNGPEFRPGRADPGIERIVLLAPENNAAPATSRYIPSELLVWSRLDAKRRDKLGEALLGLRTQLPTRIYAAEGQGTQQPDLPEVLIPWPPGQKDKRKRSLSDALQVICNSDEAPAGCLVLVPAPK
jgi:hypothetical protein